MSDQFHFSWCETPNGQMMGDWYHVTDVNGEHVAYVVKRGPREWYAHAKDGTRHVAATRGAAVTKAVRANFSAAGRALGRELRA